MDLQPLTMLYTRYENVFNLIRHKLSSIQSDLNKATCANMFFFVQIRNTSKPADAKADRYQEHVKRKISPRDAKYERSLF